MNYPPLPNPHSLLVNPLATSQTPLARMELTFYKYQGTGNDFIIFDNRDQKLPSFTEKNIKNLCDRKFGIGADGVMLLNTIAGYDFEMETSAIYGLGKTLGHHCLSLSAIVANRIRKDFSKDGNAAVENLIIKSLEIIGSLK